MMILNGQNGRYSQWFLVGQSANHLIFFFFISIQTIFVCEDQEQKKTSCMFLCVCVCMSGFYYVWMWVIHGYFSSNAHTHTHNGRRIYWIDLHKQHTHRYTDRQKLHWIIYSERALTIYIYIYCNESKTNNRPTIFIFGKNFQNKKKIWFLEILIFPQKKTRKIIHHFIWIIDLLIKDLFGFWICTA